MNTEQQEKLFEFLAHGDDEHRRWLREAIDAFFSGKPRPEANKNTSREPTDGPEASG